jgi:hypothetical protein
VQGESPFYGELGAPMDSMSLGRRLGSPRKVSA